MGGSGAACCKFIFACLNFAFTVVGFYFYGYGGWLKKRADSIEEGNLLSLIFKICMGQGTAMEAMATCGVYYYRIKKGFSLKVFSAFLAALALADIVIGVVLYFKCEEVKEALKEFPWTKEFVLASFLGTAALLTVALVCTIFVEKKTRQGNEHYTARFSSPS